MKSIILILCLCFYAFSFGRHVLQSRLHMPRPGDEVIKQQVSWKDPGRSGENVLWDFSRLDTENEGYKLTYSSRGDSVLVGTEHRTMYCYSLSGDSLLSWGYENATTLMVNRQPELLLRFPAGYSDSTFCYYSGEGRYCDRLSISAMGTFTSKADAFGMMVLPGGDTLKNVLRVYTRKVIAEETKPLSFHLDGEENISRNVTADSIDCRLANDTVLLEVETYRWYAKGYRYPVFETVRSSILKKDSGQEYFNTAFFYPPQEHYYLEEDPDNLAEQEETSPGSPDYNPWAGLTYNLYPNPVQTNLDIEIYLPRPAQKVQVQLSDRQGRLLLKEDWGAHPGGILSRQIYMGLHPFGEYLLNVWLDGYRVIESKVLKR